MKNIFKKVTLFVAMIMAVCAISVVTSTEAKAATITLKQTGATETSISISWTPVAGAYCYKVYMGGVTAQTQYTGGTMTGLQTGRKYYTYVTAYNASGYSIGSSESVYCVTKPKVGKIWLDEWKQGTTTPKIKWQNENYTYPDGYEVCLMNAKGKTVKTITAGSDAYYKFVLPGGSTVKNKGFSIKVRAFYNTTGGRIYGDWSAEQRFAPMPKMKFSSGSKTLSWAKIPGAKSYSVYRRTLSGSYKKYKTVKSTSVVINQPTYSTYRYYVVANGLKVHGKKINSTAPESIYVMSIYCGRR